MGRRACDVAKNALQKQPILGANCVTARYTDSCQFILPEGSKLHVQLKGLQKVWPIIQK